MMIYCCLQLDLFASKCRLFLQEVVVGTFQQSNSVLIPEHNKYYLKYSGQTHENVSISNVNITVLL